MAFSADKAIAETVTLEGEWTLTNDPRDKGGMTFGGISRYHTLDKPLKKGKQPTNAAKELWKAVDDGKKDKDGQLIAPERAVEAATRVYKESYWSPTGGKLLPCYRVAWAVYDAAVLYGPGRAVMWLQELLGADVDGVAGKQTKDCLMEYLAVHTDGRDNINLWMKRKRLGANDRKNDPTYRRGHDNRAHKVYERAAQLDAQE